MVLVDTSVWVAHFRNGLPALQHLLLDGRVHSHPFVIGELACGHLKNRREILSLLSTLSQTPMAEHHEVLHFIENHRLMGVGLGWIDVHLLASATLGHIPLWTLDRRLAQIALKFHLSYVV